MEFMNWEDVNNCLSYELANVGNLPARVSQRLENSPPGLGVVSVWKGGFPTELIITTVWEPRGKVASFFDDFGFITREVFHEPGEFYKQLPEDAVCIYREPLKSVALHFERYGLEKDASFVKSYNKFIGLDRGWIPGSPNTLLGTLVGGVLGGSLGYGGGYLVDYLLDNGDEDDEGGAPIAFRRLGLLLGGVAGASPGLVRLLINVVSGRGINESEAWSKGTTLTTGDLITRNRKEFDTKINEPVKKEGSGDQDIFVDVDKVNELLWNDPYVVDRTPAQTRAALSGVFEGASQRTGSRLVTPGDIGRVAIGMGSGYLSGALVGNVMGKVLGLKKEYQDVLKRTGALAGLVKGLTPLVFGG